MSKLEQYIDNDGNEILTTHQLRGMYNEDKNNYIEDIVNQQYTYIYNVIIELAIKGKYTHYFSIMCIEIPFKECIKQDGYKEWLEKKRNYRKDIEPKKIRDIVIKKLQTVFPDSNITKSYKNCCDYYRINW